jgi:hypothetical protein
LASTTAANQEATGEPHQDVEVWRSGGGLGEELPETPAAHPTPEQRQAGNAAHQIDASDGMAQVGAA